MGWRCGGLICMALLAARPAWSAPAITNPDWLRKPNGEDLSDAYPPIALALSLSGRATIRCLVNAQGALRDCEADSETPAGFGFGAAALSLGRAFVMRPLTVAGTSVDGGEVRIPIAFQYPADAAPAGPPAGPAPPAASLALARQAVAALHVADTLRAGLEADLRDLEAQPSAADPAIRAAALSAYRETMDAAVPVAAEDLARTYAATFTDRQLRDILASPTPPEGSAPYSTPQDMAIQLVEARSEAFDTAFRLALHGRFCSRLPCPAAATPTPPPGAPR